MARPNQKGLIYFSLDTKLDEKFDLIESKLGIAGFGVVIKLLQKIYSEGYFIEWNERELLKFKVRVNVEVNFINEVVQEALKWELFDNKLYETYGILTSHGIQMRYIEGTQRRKEIEFIKEYLLVSQSNLKYPSGVKLSINLINVDNNPKKEVINSQSKVKYSKENKEYKERFDTFWNAYPKKVAKGQAEKVFEKLKPDESLMSIILSAVENQKKSEQWLKDGGQFIPNPATWLNGKRWEDEVKISPIGKKCRVVN